MPTVRRPLLAAGFAAALMATAAVSAWTGPSAGAALGGALDPTFGSNGVANAFATTRADAVAEAPDGAIVLAGRAGTDLAVTRLDAAGRPDASFGTGGRATTSLNGPAQAAAVAVQPDGRIVVAALEGGQPLLLRYQRDGRLDPSFGEGGLDRSIRINPTSLALQADGAILVAGGELLTGQSLPPSTQPQVERHLAVGGLDSGFGGGGRAFLPSTGLDSATDVIALPDGRIVVSWSRAGSQDFALGRLTSTGAPDNSFDGDGVAATTFPAGPATIRDLTLLADGSIVAAGTLAATGTQGPVTQVALARYRTNGSPETGFDSDGRLNVTAPASTTPITVRVGTRPDGRIVVATGSLQAAAAIVRVLQFLPSGVPDAEFGTGGLGTANTSRSDLPLDIAAGIIQRDGRAVMAVSDGRPGTDLSSPFLLRLTTSPSTDTDRDGYWMLDASGRVYAFGDALYLGDPLLDIAAAGRFGARAVDIASTASGDGYWVVDNLGRVFAFGDAVKFGDVTISGKLTVSIARTSDGYIGFSGDLSSVRWTASGSTPSSPGFVLNEPVVDAAPAAPSGTYAVASDGGVFALGAPFLGSMGGTRLNQPVTGIAPDPDGRGYWLVAADGGIFAFEAVFKGSMGGIPLNQPVSDMVPWGDGYILVAADGGVFAFGNGPFAGSLGSIPPASPVVAVATLET
jgi:uncharacterized delta-60 repeat protein